MKKTPAALLLAAALGAYLGTGAAWAAKSTKEEPPADNTTLKFQKTLYVHKTEKGKIFAETRKITSGDTIWRILREEYGVSEEVMVSLVDVFREVNPGINPNNLSAGQVVRVPFKIESDAGAQIPPALPHPNPSAALQVCPCPGGRGASFSLSLRDTQAQPGVPVWRDRG